MVSIPELSSLLSSVAVIGGVIVALFRLQHWCNLRQMEMVISLYSTYGEESFQRQYWRVLRWEYSSFEDFETNGVLEDYVTWFMVSVFFENIGILLKRKLAKIDFIDDLISGPVIQAWEKTKPIAIGYRKKYDKPQTCEYFEYLYVNMRMRLAELEQNGVE